MEKKQQRKRTRRRAVCAFLLILMVVGFAGGLYTVDVTTGRTLHGAAYQPSIVIPSATWLPPRIQVLWEWLTGEAYFSLLADLARSC